MTQNAKSSRVEHEINENLKRAYDEVIKEPVPDRFTDLLNQLKQAEAQSSSSDQADGDHNAS